MHSRKEFCLSARRNAFSIPHFYALLLWRTIFNKYVHITWINTTLPIISSGNNLFLSHPLNKVGRNMSFNAELGIELNRLLELDICCVCAKLFRRRPLRRTGKERTQWVTWVRIAFIHFNFSSGDSAPTRYSVFMFSFKPEYCRAKAFLYHPCSVAFQFWLLLDRSSLLLDQRSYHDQAHQSPGQCTASLHYVPKKTRLNIYTWYDKNEFTRVPGTKGVNGNNYMYWPEAVFLAAAPPILARWSVSSFPLPLLYLCTSSLKESLLFERVIKEHTWDFFCWEQSVWHTG